METTKKPLEIAIDLAKGQTALADKIGGKVRQGHVSNWLNRDGGKVPPEHVIAICRAVEWGVTPHQLRSDIYPHPDDGMPRSVFNETQEAA